MSLSCRECKHWQAPDALALVGVCKSPAGLYTDRVQPHYQCCPDFAEANVETHALDLVDADDCGSCPFPTCTGDHA